MLIVAVLVAVFTVGYAFAWFVDRRDAAFNITGASAGAYFDATSGNGTTEDEAFIISNATHMRNLAVLQNTGRFGDTKYYFKIKDSVDVLDMSSIWLPPIGTDDKPFIGEFNGNGKTIANLKVTTDKGLLTKRMYPTQASENYAFSWAVGLFGNTGESSNIRNFILHNPHVVVGAVGGANGNKYKDGIAKTVGIAVGHVGGKCSSIGVRATDDGKNTAPGEGSTTLDVRVTGYSTFNSILGELGDKVESSVTGGGHTAGTGGSGAAFGSSFDVEDLLARLQKIDANRESSTPSWRLPKIDHQNTNPVPDALRKVAFSVTEESTYEGADAVEVVSNQNIGYFIGNQNKIMTSKELRFDPPMTLSGNEWVMNNTSNVPRWFYTYKTESGSYDTMAQSPSYGKTVFNPLTQDEFNELPQGIIDLLPANVGDKERFTAVRLSQVFNNTEHPFYNNDVGGWSFHGQINIMGKTYGKGFMDDDGKVVDENGEATGDMLNQWGAKIEFYNYEEGIYLPNNAVWFKPQQLGKIKFVMYAEKTGEGFALVKIIRKGATKENPFYSAPNTTGWGRGDDIFFEPVMRTSLPAGVLLYFEHEIDADELAANNVEYMIMQYGGSGAQFLYLDLGASASEDVSTVVPDTVSAVDFIYDGVEIEQEDATIGVGNFIVNTSGEKKLYNASKTSVYFDGLNQILKVVYVRLNEETGKHSGKTICLENSDTTFDTTSEVKATYATYVCPTIGGGSGTVSGSGGGGTVTPTDPVPVTSVSIADAPATLAVGGTATLTANIMPTNATDKTVTWSSSDTNVATVDSTGKVTARAAGDVTITATAKDGSGKKATATITVTGGATQYHSGTYTLNANSTDSMVTNNGATVSGSTWVLGGNVQTVNLALNVQKGKVITISVKGKRNSDKAEGINVYLGDSNAGTKLGTIDLTSTEAEGIGTVQYTATADGYVYLALGRSAAGGTTLSEITVTISDEGTVTPTPTVSGVTVTPATATVKKDETTTLSASVTMSDGSAYSGSVVWTSSDTSIATVSNNGVVTGVAKGTVTITATAGGKEATCTVEITDSTTSAGGTNLISSIGSDTISKNSDIFGGSNTDITVSIDNSSSKIALSSPVEVDGVTYTDAFISNSNGAKVFTIKAKKATTVTVYYCTTNGGAIYSAKPTLSGGTEQTTSLENVYKVEATLQADGTLTITGASSCRISILAIYIS